MKKGFVLSLLGACIAVSSQAGVAALPAVVTFTDNGKVCVMSRNMARKAIACKLH